MATLPEHCSRGVVPVTGSPSDGSIETLVARSDHSLGYSIRALKPENLSGVDCPQHHGARVAAQPVPRDRARDSLVGTKLAESISDLRPVQAAAADRGDQQVQGIVRGGGGVIG